MSTGTPATRYLIKIILTGIRGDWDQVSLHQV